MLRKILSVDVVRQAKGVKQWGVSPLVQRRPIRRAGIVWCQGSRHGRPERPEFVAGTMFLAKAEVFRPFLGRFSARDFDVSAKYDTVVTLAHVLERAIGFSACAAGRIADPDDSMRLRHLRTDVYQATAPIRRFLCQTKTTRSGARITKICRIPVWHSRKASK